MKKNHRKKCNYYNFFGETKKKNFQKVKIIIKNVVIEKPWLVGRKKEVYLLCLGLS